MQIYIIVNIFKKIKIKFAFNDYIVKYKIINNFIVKSVPLCRISKF